MAAVTVVIPAYNEAGRIQATVRSIATDYPVLVIDDGSTDGTASAARAAGATVSRQPANRGYIAALKRGFRDATADIFVTFDADGEHRPGDIHRLVKPIEENRLDLVLGARATIPRPSERLLNKLAQLRVPVRDSGTGLRALRRSVALELDLDTACTCGTLVLEAQRNGARIGEIPIRTRSIRKP